MDAQAILGLMIPFIGTSLGAACVYIMRDELNTRVQKGLSGFAAGVMVAASIWSLLMPAMDMVEDKMGRMAWMPAAIGFIVGIIFLLFLDSAIPHQHIDSDTPEGMAVGVSFAGAIYGHGTVTMAGAMVLALGIAIQNFPEGAIISMPLKAVGVNKHKSFIYGILSGAVEPVAAVLTILLSGIMVPILPYLLSFAAGAMFYVVVEELIPEATGEGEDHTNIGTIGFAAGFVVMMVLDVMLG